MGTQTNSDELEDWTMITPDGICAGNVCNTSAVQSEQQEIQSMDKRTGMYIERKIYTYGLCKRQHFVKRIFMTVE